MQLFFKSLKLGCFLELNKLYEIYSLDFLRLFRFDFPKALTEHLNKAKPEITHESFVFVYPTADQKMNTEQIAVLFGQYIHNKLDGRLLEGDKISIISHSQGGLVSLIWYFNAYLQHHNIAQESVAAIGLYWESDVAVPLPVARFDSIYTVDRNENYVHGQVSGIEKTQKSDFAPLLIINSIHASPNAKLFPDMVEVPRTCLLSINCPHPYLQLISRREPQLKTSSLISG